MRKQPRMKRVDRHGLWLPYQHQYRIGVTREKSQARRKSNSRTDVTAHGIDSNPDHEKSADVKI